MFFWDWLEHGIGSTRTGVVGTGRGIWGAVAEAAGGGRWHVGIAVGVTAVAGLALAATLVVSSRRGSLKSPWSRSRRKRALSRRQWRSFFSPDGKLRDGGVKFLKKARSGGIEPSIRAEVWPFLLGVYDLNSTEAERTNAKKQNRSEYEGLRKRCRLLLNLGDNGLKIVDEVDKEDITSTSEDPEAPAVEDFSTKTPLAIDEGSDVEDHQVFDRTPERCACLMEEVKDNEDAPLYDTTPSTCGVEEVRSNEDLPVYDKTPDGSGYKTDERRKNKGQTVYDKTPESNANAGEVEEDLSGLTSIDTSAMETESSDSESTTEEDDTGIAVPTPTEGIVGPDPEYAKIDSFKGDIPNRMEEDFATWQRIIRLDAVRANSEWVNYSPDQATISALKANQSAVAVGLSDYDHLEPCMIYHAARLVAVLEAYALYDPEIGYCQGMSDLLSPIVVVMEEDHDAFWCFVGFMRKARHNFRLDEVGIRRQLSIVAKIIKSKDLHLYRHLEKLEAEDCFFVYRMVVVLFRRELSFEQTVCLWEVMWADQAAIRAGIGRYSWGKIRLRAPPTEDLLLYAIAACVLQRRKLIVERYSSMDEILRECNNMAGNLDVWKLLDDAHDLVVTLHDRI